MRVKRRKRGTKEEKLQKERKQPLHTSLIVIYNIVRVFALCKSHKIFIYARPWVNFFHDDVFICVFCHSNKLTAKAVKMFRK